MLQGSKWTRAASLLSIARRVVALADVWVPTLGTLSFFLASRRQSARDNAVVSCPWQALPQPQHTSGLSNKKNAEKELKELQQHGSDCMSQ